MSNITVAAGVCGGDNFNQTLNSLRESFDNAMKYVIVPLTIVSITGSFINIYVFTRKRFIRSSISFNMIFLSIFNILQSFSLLSPYFAAQDVLNSSSLLCKLNNYWKATGPLFVPWISVLLCLDVVISTWSVRARQKFEKYKIRIVIFIALMIPLFLLNVEYFAGDMYDFGVKNCTASSRVQTNSFFYDVIIMVYLPFALMIILNIILGMIYVKRNREKNAHSSIMKKYSFTPLILTTSFALTFLPASIFQIIYKSFNDNNPAGGNKGVNCTLYKIVAALESFTYILRSLYGATHFFILLATNSLYRQYLINLIFKIKHTSSYDLKLSFDISKWISRFKKPCC